MASSLRGCALEVNVDVNLFEHVVTSLLPWNTIVKGWGHKKRTTPNCLVYPSVLPGMSSPEAVARLYEICR